MPAPLLTFLKYIFLVLLYLFFLRVLRAVWIELREPKVVGPETPGPVFADSIAVAPSPLGAAGGWAAAGSGATTTMIPIGTTHFVVTSPPGRSGVTYPVGGEATVGRSPGCSIALPDDTFVSQVHARVFQRDGQWWVEDLGSTNGTYLGSERVRAPVIIRAGDRVQFGQTVMELRP